MSTLNYRRETPTSSRNNRLPGRLPTRPERRQNRNAPSYREPPRRHLAVRYGVRLHFSTPESDHPFGCRMLGLALNRTYSLTTGAPRCLVPFVKETSRRD